MTGRNLRAMYELADADDRREGILDDPADLHKILGQVLGEPANQTHGTTRKPQ